MNKLYVSSDSDSESDIDLNHGLSHVENGAHGGEIEEVKKLLIHEDYLDTFQFKGPDTSDSESDSDLSCSEWESVPIDTTIQKEPQPESFSITIKPNIDDEAAKAIRRRKMLLELRKKRASIHNLAIVSYLTHAFERNKWLNNPSVQKKLKKNLPKSLIKRNKAFWKKITDVGSIDVEHDLIYILKYTIKWFRLNYRLVSHGIRVLGYLPSQDFTAEDYYPHTAQGTPNLSSFISVAGKLKHNRDVGAQLYTSLLRSLGFEARLVFSLPLLDKNAKSQPKIDKERLKRNIDHDLLFPYYWTEVVNPLDKSEIIIIENMCFHDEEKRYTKLKRYSTPTSTVLIENNYTNLFYPIPSQFNQMSMHYVVSLTNQNTLFETSLRYMPDVAYRWFKKLDLRTVTGRASLLFQSTLRYLNSGSTLGINEDELKTLELIARINCSIPTTFSAMKSNPNVVTPSTLRFNEVILPDSKLVGKVKCGNTTLRKENVYFKRDIITGKSQQQWKILGRAIKEDEILSPIKKTRKLQPRTIAKRRKLNMDNLLGFNNIPEVDLYGFDQTCKYEPPVVIEGEPLPRNTYGNIEIFKPWMKPYNCSWIQLSNIHEILEDYNHKRKWFLTTGGVNETIDFVPVVIGFDFKISPGYAVPIKKGVIVSEEIENKVKRLWLAGKIEINRREVEKRELNSIKAWNMMLRGLRIKQRIDRYDV